jgi:prolipoprotein diacylglyceryl transferase
MYPILFNLGPIVIRSYGLFLVLAFVLGTYIIWKEGKRGGYNEEKLLDFAVVTLIVALIGSRLYYVLLNPAGFLEEPLRILYVWQGGFAFHGALLGAIIGGWYFCKKVKWPFWQIADLSVIAASLAAAVAKVGAFLAGSDFGTPTSMPWGVSMIGQLGARHPTQLYEALFFLILFFTLRALDRQKKRSGGIFFFFILFVGLGRWFFEFFRGDSTYLVGIRVGQLVSVVLVVIGLFGLYYFSRRDWKSDLREVISRYERLKLPKISLRRRP